MQALPRTARQAGLVVSLLLLFLTMLSYQVNRTRALSSARGAVFNVVSPIHRLFSTATLGIGSLWDRYLGAIGAASENGRLRAEVDDLTRQLHGLAEAERENTRLRALLELDAPATAGARVARVTGRDLAHRYQSLTLDRGSADGIVLDAPVLDPSGVLVGRVVHLARWTSQVQLVTDPLSGIGARLTESRSTGLLNGVDGPILELRYVDSMTEVSASEEIVTSGEDGIYPPGILLGTVESFEVGPPVPGTPRVPLARDETALFLEIKVLPGIDVLRLESVLVLDPVNRS